VRLLILIEEEVHEFDFVYLAFILGGESFL
jgi:hypothetical protein